MAINSHPLTAPQRRATPRKKSRYCEGAETTTARPKWQAFLHTACKMLNLLLLFSKGEDYATLAVPQYKQQQLH